MGYVPNLRLVVPEARVEMSVPRWEVKIERNGIWPTPWCWEVWCKDGVNYRLRRGETFTKDRARRKAMKAKVSMERDDVRVVS
jgi:hypothetical protein